MGAGLDRPRSDGYRPSKYYCTSHNRKQGCPNRYISDIIIGPFVLNYLANMVQAAQNVSKRTRVDTLEKMLLRGKFFSNVDHIEREGLLTTFNNMVYGVARADFDPKKGQQDEPNNASWIFWPLRGRSTFAPWIVCNPFTCSLMTAFRRRTTLFRRGSWKISWSRSTGGSRKSRERRRRMTPTSCRRPPGSTSRTSS